MLNEVIQTLYSLYLWLICLIRIYLNPVAAK